MSKFVWITGADLQKTTRFSKGCNALAGQIGHIKTHGQGASLYGVKGSNRDRSTLYRLFLVYFNALTRHIDPVYECMT